MGVLWDVGNVIVRWDPRTLYSKIFDDEAEREAFLTHVCTMSWHSQFDRGVAFDTGMAELTALHPHYADQIGAWGPRFMEMLSGSIPETEAAIEALAARGVPQFGLTNMHPDIWDQVQHLSPVFAHLSQVVVSGSEAMVKPDAEIFHLASARTGMAPGELLFIDDSAVNIEAARALGFDAWLFGDPAGVVPALVARGLL